MVRQELKDIDDIFPHMRVKEWLEKTLQLDPSYEYIPPTNSLDVSFAYWYNRTRAKIKQELRPHVPVYRWISSIERIVKGSMQNEEFVTFDVTLMSINDDFVEDHFTYRAGLYNLPEIRKEYTPNRGIHPVTQKPINYRITNTNRFKQFYDIVYSPKLVKDLLEQNDEQSNVPIRKYITVDGQTYGIPYFISKEDFANFSIGDLLICMKAGQVTEEIRKKYYHVAEIKKEVSK